MQNVLSKKQLHSLTSLCGQSEEAIAHLMSACPVLALSPSQFDCCCRTLALNESLFPRAGQSSLVLPQAASSAVVIYCEATKF